MLKQKLILIGIFNILDYYFTLRALAAGFKELNPLINAVVNTLYFPLIKLVVIPLLLVLIWCLHSRINQERFSFYVRLMFFAYLGVLVYHRLIYRAFS